MWACVLATNAGKFLNDLRGAVVVNTEGVDECLAGEGTVVDETDGGEIAVGEIGSFGRLGGLEDADFEGGCDVEAIRVEDRGVER